MHRAFPSLSLGTGRNYKTFHGLHKKNHAAEQLGATEEHTQPEQAAPGFTAEPFYHIQVGNYSFFRDLNALGAGEREGCNYISSRSPAVGKLPSSRRAVTKAPLNPECQTDGVFGSLSVSHCFLVPVFLRVVTSLSLPLSPPIPTFAEENPGAAKRAAERGWTLQWKLRRPQLCHPFPA